MIRLNQKYKHVKAVTYGVLLGVVGIFAFVLCCYAVPFLGSPSITEPWRLGVGGALPPQPMMNIGNTPELDISIDPLPVPVPDFSPSEFSGLPNTANVLSNGSSGGGASSGFMALAFVGGSAFGISQLIDNSSANSSSDNSSTLNTSESFANDGSPADLNTPENNSNISDPDNTNNPANPSDNGNPNVPGDVNNPSTPNDPDSNTPNNPANPNDPINGQDNPSNPGDTTNPSNPNDNNNNPNNPSTPGDSNHPDDGNPNSNPGPDNNNPPSGNDNPIIPNDPTIGSDDTNNTNVVPEPATLSLLGMGLGGLWFRKRKLQK